MCSVGITEHDGRADDLRVVGLKAFIVHLNDQVALCIVHVADAVAISDAAQCQGTALDDIGLHGAGGNEIGHDAAILRDGCLVWSVIAV